MFLFHTIQSVSSQDFDSILKYILVNQGQSVLDECLMALHSFCGVYVEMSQTHLADQFA